MFQTEIPIPKNENYSAFFPKICHFEIYTQIKEFRPQNSATTNLVSCETYLWRFLEFFGYDENDPK